MVIFDIFFIAPKTELVEVVSELQKVESAPLPAEVPTSTSNISFDEVGGTVILNFLDSSFSLVFIVLTFD